MPSMSEAEFVRTIEAARADAPDGVSLVVPVAARLLADQLTPVLAYRRLVEPDERTAPSFLLESVEGGEAVGRYSVLGSRPVLEVVAKGDATRVIDRRRGTTRELTGDPMDAVRAIAGSIRFVARPEAVAAGVLPACAPGGWFGYAGYDAVRYAEPGKLDPGNAPPDDRGLADVCFGLYDGVVAFDHAKRLVYVVQLVFVAPGDDPGEAYRAGVRTLDARVERIEHERAAPIAAGRLDIDEPTGPPRMESNTTRGEHAAMLERALGYIRAGDIFQVVLGQRFEKRSKVDPFEVYRALRAVNPSPYMVYLQAPGCIVVSSSPEILCRVRRDEADAMVVTNRPLAGTRRRGASVAEDIELEAELRADPKETAEHVMLVDLGRNDVGRVARPGSIGLPAVLDVERYSHVMHLSSTVTGVLREGLDCWDALRAALPVGTISGAPKIRAMQIIDELEKVRRGPYGGGLGWVSLDGEMDIALALRTIVVPTGDGAGQGEPWTYHLQSAGGIVADSQADAEYDETVNKAAALARAIELAERAFG